MSGDDKEKPMSTTTISGDFAELFGKMAERLATVKGIASLPGGGECKILGVEGVKDGAIYLVSGGMVAGVMSEDNARKARVEAERREDAKTSGDRERSEHRNKWGGFESGTQAATADVQLKCAEAEIAELHVILARSQKRADALEAERDKLKHGVSAQVVEALQRQVAEFRGLRDRLCERAERAEKDGALLRRQVLAWKERAERAETECEALRGKFIAGH